MEVGTYYIIIILYDESDHINTNYCTTINMAKKHGVHSLLIFDARELLPLPTKRCDATTVVAISRKGGKIDVCNPHTKFTLSSITLPCQV
jgi:hypothetical protein